ncbi:Protein PDC2 [Phytophthora citrophthora]|uniref:Protein PDC2 n=1 Tax=Phytophthora citrophthora TaxID=4793 RepID=A0AAD9G042_9STRA|nr:Protein PDC2 [Phytophthora citrophthora]
MGRKQKHVGNLTFEQKKKVYIWHDDHPSMTQTELAEKAKKKFVLDKQPGQATISGLLKNTHRYKNAKDEDQQSRRTRKVVYPELDEALANWILCCQTRGIMLDGNIVKAKGARMLDKMGGSWR